MLRAALNWLIRPNASPAPPPQAPDNGAIADLGARLAALEKTYGELVDIRLQWTEVLDKLQRWTNRQNARDARRLQTELGTLADSTEDAPGPTIPQGAGVDPHQLKNALRQRLRAQNGGSR